MTWPWVAPPETESLAGEALGWQHHPEGTAALLGLSVALVTSLLLQVPHTHVRSDNDPALRLCRLNRSGSRGKSHWTWGVFIYGRQAPKASVGRIPGRGECGWEKLYLFHESWQKTMMVSSGLKTMMISAGLVTLSLIETIDIFIPHSTVVDEPLVFHLKCWFCLITVSRLQ